MDLDDGQEDEGPAFAWLPPEDRLWRHPSEVGAQRAGAGPRPAASAVRSARARPIGTTLCAGVIGALLALGVGIVTGYVGHHTVIDPVPVPSPNNAALTSTSPAPYVAGDWSAIADALAPSLVAIRVSTPGGEAISSGMIYTAAGNRTYVVTAADVAMSTGMTAIFEGGKSEAAHLVAADPTSGIALLWVAGEHGDVPTLGSVSNLAVADPVLAVGARTAGSTPVGQGAVTGVDQQLDTEGGSTLYGMLAVSDVTISGAADGGAVVDAAGEVIGIATDLTSVDASAEGEAFAVPINTAVHVVTEMLKGRHPSTPWVGIDDATDLSTSAATAAGVSGGALVGSVAPGSPAAADGIVPGDIVTSFAGEPVASSGALVMLLALCHPAERTRISYVADGESRTLPITVGVSPTFAG